MGTGDRHAAEGIGAMPKPIKVTPLLAALLLRDLDGLYLPAAQKAGFAPPEIKSFLDGLTRADARKLLEWGALQPAIRAAFADAKHPDHAAVRSFERLARYFANEHPANPDGSPTAWPEPLSSAARDFVEGRRADLPAAELTRDQAGDVLAYFDTRSDLRDAHGTADNPRHRQLVDEVTKLYERAHAPEASPAPEGATVDANRDPATAARLAELRADPAYADKNHPGHQAALDAVGALYQSAARGAAPPAPGAGAKTAQQRIAAVRENPAYWDKGHAGHAAAVQEAAAAFAEAYPEPAAPAS